MYSAPIVDTTKHHAKDDGRLTILICTPDSKSYIFRRCYDSLMETRFGIPFDLLIYDNQGDANFSHQRYINKAIDLSDGPLLLLDDDCILQGQWLPSMLEQLGAGVGAVSCAAENIYGSLRTRGATFTKDGQAVLYRGPVDGPIYVPATGSYCLLLNLPKWPGHLRFSTEYKKYFFDPDLLLQLWEHGLSTVTIPNVIVHESGGQMQANGINRNVLSEVDRLTFRRKWIDSKRIYAIYETHGHTWPEALRIIK